jgi:hypothetical protein
MIESALDAMFELDASGVALADSALAELQG